MANTGFNVNEGITEYLTRVLCRETHTAGRAHLSGAVWRCVESGQGSRLKASCAAYFNGDVLALARKVEDLDPELPDRFDEWIKAVDAGRDKEAATLLPAK